MPQKVLLTGASGYIAGWIAKFLLEEGYEVHGTVRDPSNTSKTQHLIDLAEKSTGTLVLHKADLLNSGDFDEAMKGCEVVFHTASPFIIGKVKDPKKMIIEPAIRGTENVLEAANRAGTVRRVVLTSSVAAVLGDSADIEAIEGDIFDESNWNQSSSDSYQEYSYSKLVAERRAWEIAGVQDKWQLTTINPAFVLGPSLTNASNSGSIDMMTQMGSGKARFGLPKLYFGVVDVRDVAQAHLNAAFMEGVKGRHILSSKVLSLFDISQILKESFPDYPLPSKPLPYWMVWLVGPTQGYSRKFVKNNVGIPIKLDNSKSIKSLGIKYRNIEDSICEQFQQLIDNGAL